MPNFCLLPVHDASCIKSPDSRFFDIDECLRSFRNVLKSCARYRQACQTPTTSPTCVAEDIESPTQRQHAAPNPINLKRKLDQLNLVEVFNERQLNPWTGPSPCSPCPLRGANQWSQKIATTPPKSTDAGLTFIPQDFPSNLTEMSVMTISRQDTAVIVAARSQALWIPVMSVCTEHNMVHAWRNDASSSMRTIYMSTTVSTLFSTQSLQIYPFYTYLEIEVSDKRYDHLQWWSVY